MSFDKLKQYGAKAWYITGIVFAVVVIGLLIAGILPGGVEWLKKPMSELSVWGFLMILGIFSMINK